MYVQKKNSYLHSWLYCGSWHLKKKDNLFEKQKINPKKKIAYLDFFL